MAGEELKMLGPRDPVLRGLFLSDVTGQWLSTCHDSKMLKKFINSKHSIFNNTPPAN